MNAQLLADLPDTLSGWLIIALLAPGLLVLVALVVAFVTTGLRKANQLPPAAGYYHVLGIDQHSGARREAMMHAETEQAARGRAAMDGIMVTEIRLVKPSDD